MGAEVASARSALGFSKQDKVIGLFPGSRNSELEFLGETIVETAAWCYKRDPNLKFVVAVVSEAHREKMQVLASLSLPITYIVGNARLAMAACDLALVASGTAALELMLYKKPMVVLYKMNPITYQIAKRLVKLPYIALPNILSQAFVVPEFIQTEAEPEKLGFALFEWLEHPERVETLQKKFTALHQSLRKDAAANAARAIAGFIS